LIIFPKSSIFKRQKDHDDEDSTEEEEEDEEPEATKSIYRKSRKTNEDLGVGPSGRMVPNLNKDTILSSNQTYDFTKTTFN